MISSALVAKVNANAASRLKVKPSEKQINISVLLSDKKYSPGVLNLFQQFFYVDSPFQLLKLQVNCIILPDGQIHFRKKRLIK